MVFLINFLSKTDNDVSNTIFFISFLISYLLLIATIVVFKYERHNISHGRNDTSSNITSNQITKNKFKLSQALSLLTFYKAGIYLVMIVLSGILIDTVSTWIIEASTIYNIIHIYITFSITLLLIHCFLEGKLLEYKYLYILLTFIVIYFVFYYVINFKKEYYFVCKLIAFLFLTIYTVHLFHIVAVSFARPFNSFNKKLNYKKHLILFLSKTKSECLDKWKNVNETDFKKLLDRVEIINKECFFNWKMPLIAIDYHFPKLKKITIITSNESYDQSKYFKDIISKALSDEVGIDIMKGIDFSSFENVEKATKDIIKNKEFDYECTVIDFTGGTKPTTVAAVLAATIYPVYNQYVDTSNYEVIGYNFKYVNPGNM